MPNRQRPQSVSVIGRVWLKIGLLMCIGSACLLLFGLISMRSRVPLLFLMAFLVAMVIQGALGGFVVTASVQFLKLAQWGRKAIVGITWGFLMFDIGFSIIWMTVVPFFAAAPPGFSPAGFTAMMLGLGTFVMLLWATPLIVALRYLHSPTIRDAFSQP